MPIPRGIDEVPAAAMLLKGMTAEMLVRRVWRVGRVGVWVCGCVGVGVGVWGCKARGVLRVARWLAVVGLIRVHVCPSLSIRTACSFDTLSL